MRQVRRINRRQRGTVLMITGVAEFGVGWVMWASKPPTPIYWVFWIAGIVLFLLGRRLRRSF